MDSEVTKFEESIFFFADAQHRLHGPDSKIGDQSSASPQTPIESPNVSCNTTPPLTRGPSPPLSIKSSNDSKRISFGHRLLNLLNFSASEDSYPEAQTTLYENPISIRSIMKVWKPGSSKLQGLIVLFRYYLVKRIIDSIPAGRYPVATSGAKTYGIFFTYLIFPNI